MAGTNGRQVLVEDLTRQCFLGYEDADEEEIRGMVRLFESKSAQASAQQRRAFEELAGTTRLVSLAQQRLQQLDEGETEAEARAGAFECELGVARAALRDQESSAQASAEALMAQLAEAQAALASSPPPGEASTNLCARLEAEVASGTAGGGEAEAELEAALRRLSSLERRVARRDASLAKAGEELQAAKEEIAEHEAVVANAAEAAASTEAAAAAAAQAAAEVPSGAAAFAPNLRYSQEAPSPPRAQHNGLRHVAAADAPSAVDSEEQVPVSAHAAAAPARAAFVIVQDPSVAPMPQARPTVPSIATSGPVESSVTTSSDRRRARSGGSTIAPVALSYQDDGVVLSSPTGKQGGEMQNAMDSLARSTDVEGAGVRYLLGRRQPNQGFGEEAAIGGEIEESMEPDVDSRQVEVTAEMQHAQIALDRQSSNGTDVAHFRSSWAAAQPTALTASTTGLVDRLYDECLARGGGHLRGASAVRRVLLELSGEGNNDPDAPVNEPPQLGNILRHLGSSVDADVTRAQFRALVGDALALRQSQEVSRYEAGDSMLASMADLHPERLRDIPELPESQMQNAVDAAMLRGSDQPLQQWPALQSWSVDFSKMSMDISGRKSLEAPPCTGTAAEHWASIETALEKLITASSQMPGANGASELKDLRLLAMAFAQSFQDEAHAQLRHRLRAAQGKLGTLLDQRKRAVEDLGVQLEAKDAAVQRAIEECTGLTARLRAATQRAEHAEQLAAASLADLERARAEAAEAAEHRAVHRQVTVPIGTSSSEPLPTPPPIAEPVALMPGASMATFAETLRRELGAAEQQRDQAEAARRESEQRLAELSRRYDEDARTFHGGAAKPPPSASLSQSTAGKEWAGRPDSLLEELEGAARDSMLQRAIEAEESLRRELEDVKGELERRKGEEVEVHEEKAATAASDAASVEEKLGELHGGTFFDKVAFHRSLKQLRFCRLSFDLKRIEWGPRERGPMKMMSVDAIIRVDFGDASRTFRCFEFGKGERPDPGLCMSISTPSRSLDLVAKRERDIEMWVLGLNEVVPYRPERQRFTAKDFYLRRAILKVESAKGEDDVDSECRSNSTTSTASAVTSVTSRRTGSGLADAGSVISGASRGAGGRVRSMLPGRPAWGLHR